MVWRLVFTLLLGLTAILMLKLHVTTPEASPKVIRRQVFGSQDARSTRTSSLPPQRIPQLNQREYRSVPPGYISEELPDAEHVSGTPHPQPYQSNMPVALERISRVGRALVGEGRFQLSASELLRYVGYEGARFLLHDMGRHREVTAIENWRFQNPSHQSVGSGPLAHLAYMRPHPQWYPIIVNRMVVDAVQEGSFLPAILGIQPRNITEGISWFPVKQPGVVRWLHGRFGSPD